MRQPIQIISGTTMVVCLLSFVPHTARADIQAIRSADSAIAVSAGGTYYNYKEPSAAPDLPDSEHGWVPSVAGSVSYMTGNNTYLALESALTYGDANYNGSFISSPTVPVQGTTRETISATDVKLGQGFAVGQNTLVTPYVEVGFRYWDRNLGGGQSEDYRNFDTLGGVMVQVAPTSRFILSAYGAGGTTFGAQAKADPDTFDLGSAAMYKIGGKIGYDLTQKTEVFTTVDYDHFHYGQSAVASDDFYEPSSNTGETALRVGLAYHFK